MWVLFKFVVIISSADLPQVIIRDVGLQKKMRTNSHEQHSELIGLQVVAYENV